VARTAGRQTIFSHANDLPRPTPTPRRPPAPDRGLRSPARTPALDLISPPGWRPPPPTSTVRPSQPKPAVEDLSPSNTNHNPCGASARLRLPSSSPPGRPVARTNLVLPCHHLTSSFVVRAGCVSLEEWSFASHEGRAARRWEKLGLRRTESLPCQIPFGGRVDSVPKQTSGSAVQKLSSAAANAAGCRASPHFKISASVPSAKIMLSLAFAHLLNPYGRGQSRSGASHHITLKLARDNRRTGLGPRDGGRPRLSSMTASPPQ